jgi:hypothetical protein
MLAILLRFSRIDTMPDYTIQPGDTLSALAVKNKVDLNDIMKANPGITNPNKIFAGQKLSLPYQTPPGEPKLQEQQPEVSATKTQPSVIDYRQLLTDSLATDEGFRKGAYRDPLNPNTGPITVGYGTTRNAPGALEYLRSQDLDPDKVFSVGSGNQSITEAQGRHLMGLTLDRNLPQLKKMYPGFDSFPRPAQNALQNMSYQMGTAGVGNFKNMSHALRQPEVDWNTVYDEALDSRWARDQTPDRAKRVSEAFRQAGNSKEGVYHTDTFAAQQAAEMAKHASGKD